MWLYDAFVSQSLKANNEESPICDLLSSMSSSYARRILKVFVFLDPNETLRPELESEIRSNTYLFTQRYIGRELDMQFFDQLMGQVRVIYLCISLTYSAYF